MKLLAALFLVSVVSQCRSQFNPTGVPPTATNRPDYTFPDTGYDGPRRCMVGTRSFDLSGRLTSDTAFPSLCPESQHYCAYFSYNITSEDENGNENTYWSQTGYCVEDPAEVTCEIFTPFAGLFGNVRNCVSRVCRDSNDYYSCNQFLGEAGHCDAPTSFATDIQLFPGCTLQQTLQHVAECATILFQGYPAQNDDQCRNTWDRAVSCLANAATRCLASNCPSILDDVQGFRSEYPAITLNTVFIYDVNSLSDRIRDNFGMDIAPFFIPVVCSGDGSAVLEQLGSLQEVLAGVDLEGLLRGFGVPLDVCPGIVNRLRDTLFRFIPAVLGANNPAAITRAFANVQRDFFQAFQGCDTVGVFGQFTSLLNSFDIGIPIGTVVSVLQTASNLLPEILPFFPEGPTAQPDGPGPIPGACPAEEYRPSGFGQVRLNCQRFYDDNTRCGRRRAWMCDYSSWRLNFLRSWRSEWNRNNNNQSRDYSNLLPECRQEDNVNCARSQRCCYATFDGCSVCFCQQHDYLQPEFLEGRWGEEASSWDRFFNVYQNILADQLRNNREQNNNDHNDDHETC